MTAEYKFIRGFVGTRDDLSVAQITPAASGRWYTWMIQHSALTFCAATFEVAGTCENKEKDRMDYLEEYSFLIVITIIISGDRSLYGDHGLLLLPRPSED